MPVTRTVKDYVIQRAHRIQSVCRKLAGVTVEKKEGRLKDDKDVTVTDLPGIYSLSPYTLEEVLRETI